MSQYNKPKALIFDLGNVLVNIDFNKFIINAGLDSKISEIEIYNRMEKSALEFEMGKINAGSFYKKFKCEFMSDISFEKFKYAWCSVATDMVEGIDDLVKSVVENYHLYLLSNTNELHYEYIRNEFSVLEYFGTCFLSYKIGYLKPDKNIYLFVLDKLNLKPDEVFYVDDKRVNIDVAEKLGIISHHFKNSEELKKVLKYKNIME